MDIQAVRVPGFCQDPFGLSVITGALGGRSVSGAHGEFFQWFHRDATDGTDAEVVCPAETLSVVILAVQNVYNLSPVNPQREGAPNSRVVERRLLVWRMKTEPEPFWSVRGPYPSIGVFLDSEHIVGAIAGTESDYRLKRSGLLASAL